jgi:hypothetical protein
MSHVVTHLRPDLSLKGARNTKSPPLKLLTLYIALLRRQNRHREMNDAQDGSRDGFLRIP